MTIPIPDLQTDSQSSEVLISSKIDESINAGKLDIEEGRYIELTLDNIKTVLSKPISQW